jgi:WD40 repeat protein
VRVIALTKYVTSMGFSPDSRYLAFTSEDNVHLMDISTGEWNPLFERTNLLSNRLRIAFDDSGLLTVGDFHRLTGVWAVEDGHVERAAASIEQFDAGLRAYLETVSGATLLQEQQPVDTATAQAWAALEQRGSSHYERGVMSPSPDGRHIILGHYDGWELWNLNPLERIAPLHGPNEWLYEVGILPGNAGVVASSHDIIHIWRFADGQHISLDLRQSGGSVQQMLTRNDPPLGLFSGWTGSLRLLDLTTGAARHSLDNITAPNSFHDEYEITPDERTIALNRQDGSTFIWDLQTGEVVSQLTRTDPEQRYRPLAFSPDGTLLAADIQDQDCRCRLVSLWDVATGESVSTLGDTGRTGWTAIFSPDGSHLIAAGGDTNRNSYIRIWNIESGAVISTFNGPRYNIYKLMISPDGRYVVGTTLTEVWLWDIQAEPGQATLLALSDDERDYVSAALNPRGDLLAVGTTHGEILLFDVASGEQIVRLQQHKGRVQDIAFSADGQMIASAGADGTVRLWRIEGSSPMRTTSSEPVVLPTVAATFTPTPAFG